MFGEETYDKRWWTLAVLSVSLLVIGVDNTILNVALPSIVQELHAQGSQLQWIVDTYVLVFAGLLLTAGSLGDRFGRKRALTFGLVLFGIFSALASQATSPTMLMVFRGLMGIGGAFIFPTTLSILTNTFREPRERAKAIGIWAGVSGIGVVIGPLGGGLLLEHYSWGSVFLVNVPIVIVAIVLGHYFIPDSRDPDESALDPVGALLSIVGLGGLLYGIIQAPDQGWADPKVFGGILSGIIVLTLFLIWELRSAHPMLQLRIFRNPRFSAASATITLTYFAMFGSTFLLTQYFQFVLGYSPLKAGFMTAPIAVGLMIAAPRAPKLVDKHGSKRVILLGLAIVLLSLSVYGCDTIMSVPILGMLARGLFGVGIGLTTAPATESIMGALPPGRAGVGSAVNDTTRQTGGALGVAVLGSIFASRYHAAVGSAAEVPVAARGAVQDSIGNALEAARSLPADQADRVRRLAEHAALSGMRMAYVLALAFVIGAMVVCWRYLPAEAAVGDPEPTAEERLVAEALAISDA
jgi:EmrB/QacA subfamily drug resistance transporter